MSIFANDSNMLILLIGLVLFALVAAFLFWTRPRPDAQEPMATDAPATIITRSAIGNGRSLVTVHFGTHEHLLLLGPQADLLIDSRKIPVKQEAKTSRATVPMPFPPASDFKIPSPRLMPAPQPLFEPSLEPQVPQVTVPQPHTVLEPPPAPTPAHRIEPVITPAPAVVQDLAPTYQPPVYQPQPAPVVAPVPVANPPHYDNVFQASVQTHQHIPAQTFSHFEPASTPPAPLPPTPPASQADIAVPAFLQSKINPVMMEQALPPAEALPPHWPENNDHDNPMPNWEAALPPLRAAQEAAPSPAPIADPTLDLAARQLEDALRQKLAETHQKAQEKGTQPELQPHFQPQHSTDPQMPATPPPAPVATPDAAADRFEQEIRKLLGRDLKKL